MMMLNFPNLEAIKEKLRRSPIIIGAIILIVVIVLFFIL